jgi:hypothetical protein
LGGRVNIKMIFFLQVHFKVSAFSSLIMFPIFATGDNDTGAVDTGGKSAAGVVETRG